MQLSRTAHATLLLTCSACAGLTASERSPPPPADAERSAAPGEAVAGPGTPPAGTSAARPAPPSRSRWDELGVKSALYVQEDHGGNPRVDEDARIVEALVVLKKDFWGEHAAMARFRGSVISSASYDAARDRAIMVSNATIKIKNPGSGEAGLGYTWHPEGFTLGIAGTIAFEYAYRSRGLVLSASRSWNEGNTTLSASLTGYHDTVRNLKFDGTHPPDELKGTLTLDLGLTQLLTPELVLGLSLVHSEQFGLLASSFGSVWVGDTQDYEIAPDRRTRDSATVRLRRSLEHGAAMELGYRYYRDDWGVEAHTLNTQLSFYLFDRSLLLSPAYRLYLQSRAYFYQPSFSAHAEYQSSDPDLGGFTGHMVAVHATFLDVYFLWLFADYDLGFNYYRRSDGLEMVWLAAGFTLPL